MFSLKKDLIVSILAQFLILFLGLIINKIIVNNVNIEDYGLYNTIKKGANVITFVGLGGLGIALPKFLPRAKNNKQIIIYILSSIIIVSVLFIIIGLFSIFFINEINFLIFESYDISLVYLMLFYGFSNSYLALIYAYLRGLDKILQFNIYQIISQITILSISIIFKSEIKDIFLYSSIGLIINSFLFYKFSNHKLINLKNDSFLKIKLKLYLIKLTRFGYSRMFGDLILFSIGVIPLAIINHKFGLKDNAYFSTATILNSLITPFFSYIGIILLPKASRAIVDRQFIQLKRMINNFLLLYISISIFFIVFFNLFSEYLIVFFFSKEYLIVSDYIKLTSLIILPNSIYLLLRNINDALYDKPLNTYNLLFSSFVGFLLMYFSPSFKILIISYISMYFILGCISYINWVYLKTKILK